MVLIQPLSSLLTEVVWPAGWVDSDPSESPKLFIQTYSSLFSADERISTKSDTWIRIQLKNV